MRAPVLCLMLILPARADLASLIEGLAICAGDYLFKPFEVGELLDRIRKVPRRKAVYAVSVAARRRAP
jgi:DNA-binding response OmpR family regulator